MSRRNIPSEFDTLANEGACRCPDWLIEAWGDLVHRSGISTEEIAELMGVAPSTLYNFATKPSNTSGHHHCPRMFYIVPATRASGNPILINALAQHAGMTTPRPRKPSGASADSLVSHAIQQIGEALKDVGNAIKERPLRMEDKRKIRDRFRSLRIVFDDFESAVGQGNTGRRQGGSLA